MRDKYLAVKGVASDIEVIAEVLKIAGRCGSAKANALIDQGSSFPVAKQPEPYAGEAHRP